MNKKLLRKYKIPTTTQIHEDIDADRHYDEMGGYLNISKIDTLIEKLLSIQNDPNVDYGCLYADCDHDYEAPHIVLSYVRKRTDEEIQNDLDAAIAADNAAKAVAMAEQDKNKAAEFATWERLNKIYGRTE